MDTVTHTLFALTLARTRLGRASRGATAALVIGSNAPDLDAVSALGGTVSYLHWHRGPTHGPLGVIGLGALTAAVVWGVVTRTRRPPGTGAASAPLSWWRLFGISALAVLFHILMDLPTSYGTRIFSPFDWHWYSLDWLPILDVYLLITLAAGLIFGSLTPEVRRHNVAIALTLVAGLYALRGTAHERALALAPRLFGPTLPRPCPADGPAAGPVDRWPHPPTAALPGGRRCLVDLAALPTFLSPFRWRIVAHLSNAYEIQQVDLLDARFAAAAAGEAPWRTVLRYPNQWTPAVAAAAMMPTVRTYLGVSRFPDVDTRVASDGVTTIRWTDMRFDGGPLRFGQPDRNDRGARRPAAFSITIRVDRDDRVLPNSP